jgi:hypothetical protein
MYVAAVARLPDIQDLDEDLAQLARHRLGFQRPGALVELQHLLALSVVEREAGPHFDIPEARVLALRSILETVIERLSNQTTRQALRILFFLDDRRPELRASTLSARRTEIVHRLPFQDEQWRRGLEDRFRALLAGELRSYEIEHRLAHMSVLPPDTVYPAPTPAHFDELESWPAYRLASDSAVANALLVAARRHRHSPPPPDVCGPSNIGNLLAAHGVDATCGFGVGYRNIHAANESASVVDIPIVYRTYRDAARGLLARKTRSS